MSDLDDESDREVSSAGDESEISASLREHATALSSVLSSLSEEPRPILSIASSLVTTLRAGGKVLLAGNGGSAAEAQHFSAELIGRFKRDRPPFAALSLTTDTSILTAVANDYSYDDVFARQVLGLGLPGDLLVAFSTSGESHNLLRAAAAAKQRGMRVAAFTGSRPSSLERAADWTVRVPAAETALVQEAHTALTHLLCGIVERELAPAP